MKTIFQVFVGIAVILALLAGLALATGQWRKVTAPFFGSVEQEVILERGNSRIQRYEAFFRACAAVQQVEATISSQRNLLAQATAVDERSRINTNIGGLEARRANHITEYNRMAAQEATSARFRDANLPERLDLTPFTGDNFTNCNL